ncbi:MAG: SIS domain-containing protein, partial [Planctomycetes bacterium]|nr:SIS domain-containing protein [Planctomycetota bacterium]
MNTDTPQAIIAYGREVIRAESAALQSLTARLDRRFAQAVGLVLNCTGRVAVTGIGKAGIVGQKISATLASTGTPSFWLQASEARHGDLGRIVREDLVLILSNSGETEEIVSLLSPVKKIGAAIISITGEPKSTLGRHSDVVLDLGKIEEACP